MTGTVTVRPLASGDEPFIWSLASDHRVVKWVGDGTPWRREYFNERFSQAMPGSASSERGAARWFVALRDPEEQVGLLTLTRTPGGIEIGYWVSPNYWGQGIAQQLVDIAISRSRGLDLTARVHPDNAASRHVLEKQGFAQVSRDGLIVYSRPAPNQPES